MQTLKTMLKNFFKGFVGVIIFIIAASITFVIDEVLGLNDIHMSIFDIFDDPIFKKKNSRYFSLGTRLISIVISTLLWLYYGAFFCFQ